MSVDEFRQEFPLVKKECEFESGLEKSSSDPIDEVFKLLEGNSAGCAGALPGLTNWELVVGGTHIPIVVEGGVAKAAKVGSGTLVDWDGDYSSMTYTDANSAGTFLAVPTSGPGHASVDCLGPAACFMTWGHSDNLLANSDKLKLHSYGSTLTNLC